MKNFIISEQLAQAVLNYLAGQPYAQVFQMIQAIQGLQEASFPVPPSPEQPLPTPGLQPQAVEEAKTEPETQAN